MSYHCMKFNEEEPVQYATVGCALCGLALIQSVCILPFIQEICANVFPQKFPNILYRMTLSQSKVDITVM